MDSWKGVMLAVPEDAECARSHQADLLDKDFPHVMQVYPRTHFKFMEEYIQAGRGLPEPPRIHQPPLAGGL